MLTVDLLLLVLVLLGKLIAESMRWNRRLYGYAPVVGAAATFLLMLT